MLPNEKIFQYRSRAHLFHPYYRIPSPGICGHFAPISKYIREMGKLLMNYCGQQYLRKDKSFNNLIVSLACAPMQHSDT